jgi:hypothetical protein
MEHLLLKAAVTVTDQGVFEAVISTGNVDRENDIARSHSRGITALGLRTCSVRLTGSPRRR